MNTKEMSVTESGTSSLERPRYYPGLLLEDEDLTSAVDYTRGSLRLLMRSLFGCGIVCGLTVDPEFWCNKSQVKVTVRKGVAFDCEGNIIEVTADHSLTFNPACAKLPDRLYVTIAYKERCCQQTTIACTEDDDGKTVPRRVMDGYEIAVSDRAPKCACSCIISSQQEKEGDAHQCCGGRLAEATGSAAGKPARRDTKADTALGCECYVDHRNLVCGCGCAGDCGCIGVLLSVITIDVANDKPKAFGAVDGVAKVVRPMLLGAACCYADWCKEPPLTKHPDRTGRDVRVTRALDAVEAAKFDAAIVRSRQDAMKSEKARLDIIGKEWPVRLRAAEQKERDAAPDKKAEAAAELATALREQEKFKAELLEFTRSAAEVDKDLKVKDKLLDLRMREQKLAEEQAQLSFINERIAVAESPEIVRSLIEERTAIATRVKQAADDLNT